MKILQIGKYYPPFKGGLESNLFTLVNALKDKLQIQVLVSHTKGRTIMEKDNNLTIIRLANFGKVFSQPLTPTLPLWIKRLRSDIIHLHLPNPLAMLSYLIVSPKGKLVISYHNDIVKQGWAMLFLSPLLIKLLDRADAIIVTSENLKNNSPVLKRFHAKCHVIPYGIDIERFNPDNNILKKASQIRQRYGSPLILFVGRLVYFKGLKYLLKAMKDIEARLLVVGDGPLKKRLKRLSNHYRIYDKVVWIGKIENEKLAPYYYASDLFVLPSSIRAEGFGIVLLEAQACARAVVSTNLPTGITFANLHKYTGLVVPPRNEKALSRAITTLLENSDLRQNYGENGRERVKREFTKEIMAEKTLRLYSTT